MDGVASPELSSPMVQPELYSKSGKVAKNAGLMSDKDEDKAAPEVKQSHVKSAPMRVVSTPPGGIKEVVSEYMEHSKWDPYTYDPALKSGHDDETVGLEEDGHE